MALARPRLPLQIVTPALLAAFALACASPAVPAASTAATAQEPPPAIAAPPATAPLASFAAMRVAILPVQLWRADSTAWSKAVDWSALRVVVDSAIAEEFQARGMGKRWAYGPDVVRSAKRNPTYAADPFAIGVGRWRAVPPKPGEQMPAIVADNLRPLTALGDTRYALVPVELRAQGEHAVLRLVMVDTRGRTVVWVGELLGLGADSLAPSIARSVADLVIEP